MAISGLIQKLNAQMNRGFHSSNLCLQGSTWCSAHSLTGTAIFLRNQAQNNITQMMRVFNYMKQAGGNPIVGTPEASQSEFECDCLESVFQQTLADHQKRYEALGQLIDEAKALQDDPTLTFLNSVVGELQQDGLVLNLILEEVRSAQKAGLCMSQTDSHLTTLVNHQHH